MPIDFVEVLEEKKPLVMAEILKYLDRFTPDPKDPYFDVKKYHQEILSEYPLRKGKHGRPTLILLTCEAMGVPQEKAMKTAAAMQISQDWILIHDDWEDGSMERRGKPALHRLHPPELAINAGDALHALMWKVLSDNRKILGAEKTFEVIDAFYRMIERTILGQTIEMKWTFDNRTDMTEEDVYLILDGKTSYYTIAGPMMLGAIIAGATQEQLDAIFDMGLSLGKAFQITDDLLDLTSDFAGLKKQMGNDIYEGKRTIMLIHIIRTAQGEDKKRLLAILEKPRAERTADDVSFVIGIMNKYGSIEYGKNLAEKFCEEAKEKFEKNLTFLPESPTKDKLRAGIDFFTHRKF